MSDTTEKDYWYMMPKKAEYLSTRVIAPENRDLHTIMTRIIPMPSSSISRQDEHL